MSSLLQLSLLLFYNPVGLPDEEGIVRRGKGNPG